MKILGFFLRSASALITFPKASKDLFMFDPSLFCFVVLVTLPFSDPEQTGRFSDFNYILM